MSPQERMEKIEQIETRLVAYIEAERAVLKGQSYSINNRSLERADLRAIQREIIRLRSELDKLQRWGRLRMYRVVPRDGI